MQILSWIDRHTGLVGAIRPLINHPVPPGIGWYYVFGSATLVAFLIQVVTGIALASAYVVSSGQAYDSLQFITRQSELGRIMRGVHFFGASAMIILIGVHTIRVYLTGSFKFPREASWVSGAVLLLLTLLMGFTGQLLRWDQNGVWSSVIAAEQAGRAPGIGRWLAHFILAGDTVGGATLSRFFAAHVFFIPALIFAFVGLHLFLVLRNGISEPPVSGKPVTENTELEYRQLIHEQGEPFWPHAAWRDVVAAAVLVSAVILLAIIVGPPELGRPPDPTIIEAYPRPDWYLLWYFALLALIPRSIENYLIVWGPIAFGAIMILLPFLFNRGERSPARRPWAVGIVIAAIMTVATLWVEGKRAPWSPDFSAPPLSADVVRASSGPVFDGAILFHKKGCEYCHRISGFGGNRGPELTRIGDRLTPDQLITRIVNGANNMPAYVNNLKPEELDSLVAFLASRKTVNEYESLH